MRRHRRPPASRQLLVRRRAVPLSALLLAQAPQSASADIQLQLGDLLDGRSALPATPRTRIAARSPRRPTDRPAAAGAAGLVAGAAAHRRFRRRARRSRSGSTPTSPPTRAPSRSTATRSGPSGCSTKPSAPTKRRSRQTPATPAAHHGRARAPDGAQPPGRRAGRGAGSAAARAARGGIPPRGRRSSTSASIATTRRPPPSATTSTCCPTRIQREGARGRERRSASSTRSRAARRSTSRPAADAVVDGADPDRARQGDRRAEGQRRRPSRVRARYRRRSRQSSRARSRATAASSRSPTCRARASATSGLRGLQVGRIDPCEIGDLKVTQRAVPDQEPAARRASRRASRESFSPLALGLSMRIDYARRAARDGRDAAARAYATELPLGIYRLATVRGMVNGRPATSSSTPAGKRSRSASPRSAASIAGATPPHPAAGLRHVGVGQGRLPHANVDLSSTRSGSRRSRSSSST